MRSINLIPFHYENEIGLRFHLSEVLRNVVIFIPFGIYLCMLKKEPKFAYKLIIIFSTTFILESAQYIIAVGYSDITDLITNTSGGLVGIIIYHLIAKLFPNREFANKFFIITAFCATILFIGLISLLLLLN